MFALDIRAVHHLFILNLCLQVFDGIATYNAVGSPLGEGNPLVAAAMTHFGIGTALVLFKLKACGFLVVLRRLAGHAMVGVAFVVLAATYAALSFFPWMGLLLKML